MRFERTSQTPLQHAALVPSTWATFSEVGFGKANENHHPNGFFADSAGSEFEKRMVSEMSR